MKINISENKFLDTKTDVAHKDVVVIENEGKWQPSERFKKEDGTPQNEFRIDLKIKSGEIRNTTFNWTNVKLLVKALGDETSEWAGKELRAWKTKSDKAKAGFVFLYVPIDWERDDTGEWVIPSSDVQSDVQLEDDVSDDSVPF